MNKENAMLRKLKKNIQIEEDNVKKGMLLMKLAESYYDSRKYKRAIFYYKQAIKYPISSTALAACYDMLGSLNQEIKDYKQAIYFHKLALKKPQAKNRKAAIYTNMARIYFNVYRKDKLAFNLFQKAFRLFDSRLNYYDKDSLSHCHYCLGVIQQERGNLPKARYHYKRVLCINKTDSDNLKKARENLDKIKLTESRIPNKNK